MLRILDCDMKVENTLLLLPVDVRHCIGRFYWKMYTHDVRSLHHASFDEHRVQLWIRADDPVYMDEYSRKEIRELRQYWRKNYPEEQVFTTVENGFWYTHQSERIWVSRDIFKNGWCTRLKKLLLYHLCKVEGVLCLRYPVWAHKALNSNGNLVLGPVGRLNQKCLKLYGMPML